MFISGFVGGRSQNKKAALLGAAFFWRRLVVAIFWLQLPHVFVRLRCIVVCNVYQNLFEIVCRLIRDALQIGKSKRTENNPLMSF